MMQTIGWKERVDLPSLGIFGVPAKIDTGARTSVLHCSHIRLIKEADIPYVEFQALDGRFGATLNTYVKPFHSLRTFRNSFGQEEERYIIQTDISLFGQQYEIELSLRDRSDMEFPLLLGRTFIRKRFLVDVSKANLSKTRIIPDTP